MQKSSIYQLIEAEGVAECWAEGWAEGYAEGYAEGFQEGIDRLKALILRQLNIQIGTVPKAEQQQVEQMSIDQLEALAIGLLDFSSSEDLSDWLQSDRPSASPGNEYTLR